MASDMATADETKPKRGPGRPRKGLVKTTLSLRPEHLAALRVLALAGRSFSPGRADVSEALRDLLDEPPVAALLKRAREAFSARMRQLGDVPDCQGLPDMTRLLFEVRRGEQAPDFDPASAGPRAREVVLREHGDLFEQIPSTKKALAKVRAMRRKS
jgi:hypothetical protein